MAAVNSLYHSEHLLAEHQYGEGSAYACAACERSVTGAGFRCGECDINVHKACLALPMSVTAKERHEHPLALSRLTAGGSCNACRVISNAGCYMYRCAACGFNLHPRCTPPLADGAQQQQQQQQQQQNGTAWRALRFLGVGFGVARIIDETTTGGLLSPVFDLAEGVLFGPSEN